MVQLNQTPRTWSALLILIGLLVASGEVAATDYFVTIGGGYVPEQNQASLEANVIFFQRLLHEKHQRNRSHDLFFSDGSDSVADLQILSPKPAPQRPVTDLLASLHRRGGAAGQRVDYRNHRVPETAGGTAPQAIQAAFSRIAQQAKIGDRLLVYVTAHGGEGPDDDLRNTTISCWGNQSITMRDFTSWLDEMPADLPVILVMAQCYCGGFADTIFQDSKTRETLTSKTRIGFFAQQFDLPAAGCRPDIEHDQEFSSYFWGAMLGQSRNGDPMPGGDADHDGTVSFDEAFAHAMIVGETIDIPMKSSDELLQQFSRIPDYVLMRERERSRGGTSSSDAIPEQPEVDLPAKMSGTIRDLIVSASPASRRIVIELGQALEMPLDGTAEDLLLAYEKFRNDRSSLFQRGPGRRRQSSGRRELLAEIGEQWPDLANPEEWSTSTHLKTEDQQSLFDKIMKLPSYAVYEQRRKDREVLAQKGDQHELKEIKYRRLIDTLENLVLSRNLPTIASPEVVDRYQRMRRLEQTALSPQ